MKYIKFIAVGLMSTLALLSCKKEELINKNLKFDNIQNAKFIISIEDYIYAEGDQFAVSVFSSADTNAILSLMKFDLNGEVRYVSNILRLNKEYFASNPQIVVMPLQGMPDISCRISAQNYGQPFYINIETWINNELVKEEKRLIVDTASNYNATFTYFN